jgi:hypothetical protein
MRVCEGCAGCVGDVLEVREKYLRSSDDVVEVRETCWGWLKVCERCERVDERCTGGVGRGVRVWECVKEVLEV